MNDMTEPTSGSEPTSGPAELTKKTEDNQRQAQIPAYGASPPPTEEPLTWEGMVDAARQGWRWLKHAASHPAGIAVFLIAILLLGAALRFTGLDWDEHQHLHPDERFLTMVENSLEWPKTFKEYLDTSVNPLNPYNRGHGTYVYGLLPLITAKFVGQVVDKTGYDGIYLVGRALSSIMDLLCVLLVFLTGKRLYGARAGLMGALLLSLTALNIQQSHFFTVDTSTTLYVTLALYLAVRVSQGSKWTSALFMAVAFGLAVAAKISVLSFLLVIGLAYVLRYLAEYEQGVAEREPIVDLKRRWGRMRLALKIDSDPEGPAAAESERLVLYAVRIALAMVAVLIVALVVFRLAQPQAFQGPGFFSLKFTESWKKDMEYISKLVSGGIDYPPSHQWTDREPVWYMFKNMVLWGMGLPLGLTVWAAWAYMAYEMYRHRKWAHLLPWVWMTFTFFYQSIQFVKTVRYLLPIYPTMALIAGYGLVRLWDWARTAKQAPLLARRWLPSAARALVILVVVGTALWALAFTSIYTRPVTRIAASRWIYQNVPPGSSISFEVWDDPVPLNIDGHNASIEYRHIKMDLYWEDIPEKREQLLQAIEDTQYIALSSNRLYGSIPRLPSRYPMTTHYYEALFSGELGYDRIMTFTSRPQLFGIEINDDDSDESFTVYDHPKVILFKKRADFDMNKVRAMFNAYDLDRIVRIMPKQVTDAPNNLMLDDEALVAQRQGGTWSELFNRDGLANKAPTLVWLLAVYVIGLAAWPLAYTAMHRYRDRGYVLSKTLGLLIVAWGAWMVASLRWLPFTRGVILLIVGLLGLAGGAVFWLRRDEMLAFLRDRWRLLVGYELMFLVFFVAFWLVRRGNPDLWHPAMGGEKPMDMAYLNAIIKSTYFPPYDPWFSGGYLNYYYYGWVVVGTVIKLTGIIPTTAYNLALPTWFALVATGAATIVYNLVPAGDDEDDWFPRAQRYGLVGALLVAVVGNLGELQLVFNGLVQLGQQSTFQSEIPGLTPLVKAGAGFWQLMVKGQKLPFRPEWWYWNASRIMQHGEINEFPYFSFLYADLHAHVTAMPFGVLALALATSLVVRPSKGIAEGLLLSWRPNRAGWQAEWRRINWARVLQLGLLALVLGELWCNNSWDFPTYTGIAIVALGFDIWLRERRVTREAVTLYALQAGAVVALCLLLYRPYHANFGLAYSSVERWKGERTPISHYLLIHGPALFMLISYAVTLALDPARRLKGAQALRILTGYGPRRERAQHLYGLLVRFQSMTYELGWLALAFVVAVVLVLLLAKSFVLALGLPLIALALALALSPRASVAQRYTMFLVATGAVLTLAVEYIVIKGDIGRMNTVFKFYLQVWIMWGIAAAVGLAHLAKRGVVWPAGLRGVWRVALILILVSVSLYPVLATNGKVRDRWDNTLEPGLDGIQFMTTVTYNDNNRQMTLINDYQAIQWMQDNIVGSPVIAEANTPLYRWGNRVSNYTGLPSVIGWDWHQKQQRAAVSGQVVDWRLTDLRTLFDTTDVTQAQEIIDRYDVGYVFVGELERAYYSEQGLNKFDMMVGSTLRIAYRSGPVTIYEVVANVTQAEPRAEAGTAESVRDWLARRWVGPTVSAQEPAKEPSGDLVEADESSPIMLDVPVEEIASVDGRGWNKLAARFPALAVLCWWLLVQILGWVAWPLTARVMPGLPDKGYAFAKGIGLLLVGYLLWIGSSLRLVANSPPSAWGVLFVLAGCSFFHWSRRRAQASTESEIDWSLVRLEEALFSVGFLAFVGLRLLNPDLWQPWFGGEKMMEMAFLNAICKSAHMPPYDPYFAGGTINYYYYGLFLVSTLLKLVGLPAEIGFNLAVPTLFGLTLSHGFGLGRALVQRIGGVTQSRAVQAGLAVAILIAVAGNLTTPVQLLEGLARAGGASFPDANVSWADVQAVGPGLVNVLRGQAQMPSFDYWYRATRVIPYTINEFPFFSFLFADLHPHMIAIPFTLIVLALGMTLVARGQRDVLSRPLFWLILIVAIGALGVINTWDLPVYWGLIAIALAYRGYRSRGGKGVVLALLGFLLLALAALLAYGPFYQHYQAQDLGLAWVPKAERSGLAPFLVIWGTHLALALGYLASAWRGETWRGRLRSIVARRGRRSSWRWIRLVAPGYVWLVAGDVVLWLLILAGMAWAWTQSAWVVLLMAPLIGVTAMLAWHAWILGQPAKLWRRLLLVAGLALLAGVEIVYLQDFLSGGEWRRMNTLFKFYIQAWVLLSVALGCVLPTLWHGQRQTARWPRHVWRVAAGALLVGALMYPLWAIPVRVNERFPSAWPARKTLDGTAYMTTGIYAWPDASNEIRLKAEREAIAWLWENEPGTPVLAQAPLGFYREGGLMLTSYTGLPTLVGMHELEQRPWDVVSAQERDAESIYRTLSDSVLAQLLDQHEIRYVYVGQLERAVYDEASLAKFERWYQDGRLDKVFANDLVTLYHVP